MATAPEPPPADSARNGSDDARISALLKMTHAVNAGDAHRCAMLYASDAVITIYGGGELKGRAAIEEHEARLLREFPGAQLVFYSIWASDALVVVHYAVQAPGGHFMGNEGLLFYQFDSSGLIEREHRYMDSLPPGTQTGTPAAARALPTLPTELKLHFARNSPEEAANVTLSRANFAALEAKDEQAFLATMTDDTVLDESIYPQPFIGKRNVKGWFETWTCVVPDATTEISTLLGVGEFVLVETVVRGTLRGPFGRLSAWNEPFAVHRAAILRVRDGKLDRVSGFINGKELAEAIGQWPPPPGR